MWFLAGREGQKSAKIRRWMERWQMSGYAWSDTGIDRAEWAFRPWYITPLSGSPDYHNAPPSQGGETREKGMLSTKPVKALSQHLVSIYNSTPT
jgi:hypothetical protein